MSVKIDRVRCVVRRDVQGPLNLYRRHGSFSSPGMAESEGRYALVRFGLGLRHHGSANLSPYVARLLAEVLGCALLGGLCKVSQGESVVWDSY